MLRRNIGRIGCRVAKQCVCSILFRVRIAGLLLVALSAGASLATAKTFECVIEPSVVVQIGGPIPGLLSEVIVERGDRVSKGQVVARLNSGVEEATVSLLSEQAKNTAEIDAQKARAELAVSRAGRAQELMKRNVTSEDKFEEAMAEMKVLQREVAMAEMRHRVSELELARAETVLDQRSIRSPIDGIVTERFMYGGEYLAQEGKVATIARLDPLNVETYLPVALFGKVQVGMQAKVTPDPPIEGTYDGKVSVVDQVFDAASGTFGVRISLSNPGLKLPAGQRCEVEFAGVGDHLIGQVKGR
jgi:RND family efflux transporter MFP subunit